MVLKASNMQTVEQKKDAERLEKYIARNNLCSLMSNAKWIKLIKNLESFGHFNFSFRVKCLREESFPENWEKSFPYHLPTPYKNIEWVELHAPLQGLEFLSQLQISCKQINITYSIDNNIMRIYGYMGSKS